MKQRRLLRFHGLRRPRLRQTWNKYNLFNLVRVRTPNVGHKTFFQQKWIAKALARGYHGEHIKESQWERMFSRRTQSVVSMNPVYMARYNGSEQAAGRGSGRRPDPASDYKPPTNNVQFNAEGSARATPYMQMTFAPMERRIDIAIFRALFASSARQARQFVLHGAVTVNGKKMTHPSYLLNPGDMFQVDIERVMAATGKPKRPSQHQQALPANTTTETVEGEEAEADAEAEPAVSEAEPLDAEAAKEKHMAILKELQSRAETALTLPESRDRAKAKRALRKYLKEVKTALDNTRKSKGAQSASEMSDAEAELTALFADISVSWTQFKTQKKQAHEAYKAQKAAGSDTTTTAAAAAVSTPPRFTSSQRRLFMLAADADRNAARDWSKPYRTPWQPRDWMAPFAFVPRYLEVNQRICAAVYLRHPVARPGLAEVPTPFSPTLSQLAFNWYLKRG